MSGSAVDSHVERLAPLWRTTCTPQELFETGVYPCSRNGIYSAIARGEIETIRVGRKIAVVCAPLRRRLGLEA